LIRRAIEPGFLWPDRQVDPAGSIPGRASISCRLPQTAGHGATIPLKPADAATARRNARHWRACDAMSGRNVHASCQFFRNRLAQYVILPAVFWPIFAIGIRSIGLALVPAVGGRLHA
jgi:hypothetical protein